MNIITQTSHNELYNNEKYNEFHVKCLKVINDVKITYKDIALFITWMCKGNKGNKSKRSFFFDYIDGMTKILDAITLKFKFEKKELVKIFKMIDKYYEIYKNFKSMSTFSFVWIKNLKKMNTEFTIDQLNILEKIGYVNSFDDVNKKEKICDFFKKKNTIEMIFEKEQEFENLIKRLNYELKIENLLYMLNNLCVTLNSNILEYTHYLLFFEKLGYKYKSYDFGKIIAVIKLHNDQSYTTTLSYQINNLLFNIGQFFTERKITLNYETIINSKLPKYIHFNNIFFHQKISSLIDMEIITHADLNENQIIMLITSHLSENTIELILNKIKINFTEKIVKISIIINHQKMINKIIAANKLMIVNPNFGFKYACLNFNHDLVKYYLNNKFEPSIEHFICISLLKSSSTNINIISEQKTTLINLINSYGIIITKEFFEILICCEPHTIPNFHNVNCQLNGICDDYKNRLKKLTPCCQENHFQHFECYIHFDDHNDYYDQPVTYDNLKIFHRLIYHLIGTQTNPTREMCEQIVTVSIKHPQILEFFNDFFGYVPNLSTIAKMPYVHMRLLLLKKYHNVDIFDVLNESSPFVLPKNDLLDQNKINPIKPIEQTEPTKPIEQTEPTKPIESDEQDEKLIKKPKKSKKN